RAGGEAAPVFRAGGPGELRQVRQALSREVADRSGASDQLQRARAVPVGDVPAVGAGKTDVAGEVLVEDEGAVDLQPLDPHAVDVGEVAAQGAGAGVDDVRLEVAHLGVED